MPLPSTGYLTTTIGTAPTGSLANFSWLVDLSQFSAVTDFWTACTSSVGLKLRCALDSDGTELPFDVWGFDNVGATGYLRIKVPSFTGTQTLRIYPSDSGNADYATPTNAYDSSWAGYWPDGAGNDRTSAGTDLTNTSITQGDSAGQVGLATNYPTAGDRAERTGITGGAPITFMAWFKPETTSGNHRIIGIDDSGSAGNLLSLYQNGSSVTAQHFDVGSEAASVSGVTSAVWNHAAGVFASDSSRTAWCNGTKGTESTVAQSANTSDHITIGELRFNGSYINPMDGVLDELQYHKTARADEWITQEYSQTDDNAAFWGAGTWNAASGNTLTADTGTFTLTGHAVSLSVTRSLTAAEGTFALTGHAVSLPVTRTLTAATGEFTLTGHAATLPVTRQLTAAEGTFALTGHAALFPVTRKLAAATGEFTLTGHDATLTPVVGNTLVASRGQFQLTGNDAAFSVTRSLAAAVGEFTLTGIDTAFSVTRNLAAATGTFALTGHDASIALVAPNVLTAESGAFTYTGYSATLLLNDAPLTVNYYTQFYYMLLTGELANSPIVNPIYDRTGTMITDRSGAQIEGRT